MKINQSKRISLIVFSLVLLAANFIHPVSKAIAQEIVVAEVGPEFNKEVRCLADNIYYEAGSETFEGKLAVATITMNRVNSGKFADTICGVVYQKTGHTYQFSWVGMAISKIKNPYQWEESAIVARKVLTENYTHDILSKSKAMYYHNTSVNPEWRLTKVTKIGNHIFYK